MIVDHKTRTVVFTMPRTGTRTLFYHMLGERGSDPRVHCEQHHFNYVDFKRLFTTNIEYRKGGLPFGFGSLDQFESYDKFCFYRDPVQRATSAIGMLRRGVLWNIYWNLLHPTNQVSCMQRTDNYDEWSQEKKDIVNAESTIEVFRRVKYMFGAAGTRGPFRSCRGYFEADVQPLNYDNYDEELAKLITRLELPNIIERPHVGKTIRLPEDELSEEDRAEMEEFFVDDYAYANAKLPRSFTVG